MIGEDGRQRLVKLYEETCRVILDMEIDSLRHNTSLSSRERDVLRTATEFKDAIWEMLIHEVNTKDPYNDQEEEGE